VSVTDDYGNTAPQWRDVATVNCRLNMQKRQDMNGVVAAQDKGRSFNTLVVAYNVDIQDGDRVTVGGVVYEINQVDVNRTDRADKQATVSRIG
jgi:SPP1 family predicted phage head-tail adaptor